MSVLLWGKVCYQDHFSGILREEPGDRASFLYDSSYLNAGLPPISHALPLQTEPHFSIDGLHPFFDNLVAEGWLEHVQTRALGKRSVSRFQLLLAFGYDCAGAVSVLDPEPENLSERLLDKTDSKEWAILTSRASLSGVQPKMALVHDKKGFRPAKIGELSSHIAKFPSSGHDDLVMNEYLTTQAFKALLPKDAVAELMIDSVQTLSEPALIIKRFDRDQSNRLHFEEFNQLLGKKSKAKYSGSYKDMSHFIETTPHCLEIETFKLYTRIVAGILLGNTDMHLKNFAMYHTPTGLRLTPSYAQVAAVIYQYKSLALAVESTADLSITTLKPKHIIGLGQEFNLSDPAIDMIIKQLNKNKEAAKDAIASSSLGTSPLKDKLIQTMETRWNGTFALIGKSLSKKP